MKDVIMTDFDNLKDKEDQDWQPINTPNKPSASLRKHTITRE